jgi:transposase
MLAFDRDQHRLVGPHGSLPILAEDDITRKLAMLIEGECDALGPRQAAETFGFSKSRYYQIRKAFQLHGAKALSSQRRGPKRQYRRTQEVTRQVIRHRFLDPDATAEVIAQKIRQTGLKISTRSVERVIEDFGLQKKTSSLSSAP